MKRSIILLTLSLLCLIPLCAQIPADSLVLSVVTRDAFSEEILTKAHVSVYAADGTTLLREMNDTVYNADVDETTWKLVRYPVGLRAMLPRLENYVVKVSLDGYDGQEMTVKTPRRKGEREMSQRFYLFRSTVKELGEASVTASKILMVTKGDTIVYNAAAFRMAEGSMLDNLVRALPGAAINDQGQITVNGEYVSTLLVNGRDFFKGDPKVALSNLPAYAVHKIKVYHKDESGRTDKSEEERSRDPLVMDVGLKREYAEGWLANFEAAGGSRLKGGFDKMWLGRVFAMRFTNHSSLAIYGVANNLNDFDSPSSKGEWRKPQVGTGQKTTYMGGINFSIDPKHTKIKFSTALQAMRQMTDDETRVTAVSYLPGGNVTNVSHSGSHDATTNVKWNAELDNGLPHLPRISLDAYYTRATLNDSTTARQYNEDGAAGSQHSPVGLPAWGHIPYAADGGARASGWLYERGQSGNEQRTQWGGNVSLYKLYDFSNSKRFSHSLSYKASLGYNHLAYDTYLHDHSTYASQSQASFDYLRRDALPSRDYNFKLNTAYELMKLGSFNDRLNFDYTYTQAFTSGSRAITQLNLQADAAGHTEADDAGGSSLVIPSMRTAAAWVPDVANSFHTTTMVRQHELQPQFSKTLPWKLVLSFSPQVTVASRRLTDYRGGQQRGVSADGFAFNPSLRLSREFHKDERRIYVAINYSHTEKLPELANLLDVRDDSDPLVRNLGNPGLKKSNDHSWWLTVFNNGRYRLNVHYSLYNQNVALARTYDRTTGVTTYQPLNIDGNRSFAANYYHTLALDKARRLSLDLSAAYNYLHSVDFANDSEGADLTRQTVDNNELGLGVRLNYNISKVRLAAKAEVEWTRLTGDRPSFARMSYTDHSYGVSVTAPLVWGIDLDADLMAYCRSGYTDRSMNTTDWVLNASLAKALGRHRQWLIRAQGFDILGQLSNVRKVVNAQGRTETWSNTIPAYATLHIVYRLDIKPKKVRERH